MAKRVFSGRYAVPVFNSITLLFMFSMSHFVVLSFVLVSISWYTFLPGWLMLEQTIPSTFQSKHALPRSIGRLLADPKGLMLWLLCKCVWTWSSWLAFFSSGIFSLITIILCINFFSSLASKWRLSTLWEFSNDFSTQVAWSRGIWRVRPRCLYPC